ncbi:MAG: hypothetical protein AAFV53_39015 [Myxococcota bacterium]
MIVVLLASSLAMAQATGGYRQLPANQPRAQAMLNTELVTDLQTGTIGQARLVAQTGQLIIIGVDVPYLGYVSDRSFTWGFGGAHGALRISPTHFVDAFRNAWGRPRPPDAMQLDLGIEVSGTPGVAYNPGYWAVSPLEGLAWYRGMFATRMAFTINDTQTLNIYAALGLTEPGGDTFDIELSRQLTISYRRPLNDDWSLLMELDASEMFVAQAVSLTMMGRRTLNDTLDVGAGLNLPFSAELVTTAQLIAQLRMQSRVNPLFQRR